MKLLSRVRLFAIPLTIAYQAPPSMEFSRQQYWSGLPFPSPGELCNPGIEPGSPTLQADPLPSEPPGKPVFSIFTFFYNGRIISEFKKTCKLFLFGRGLAGAGAVSGLGGGPWWSVASGCSLVLFVSSGASLPSFSSPSPLWPAPGETAAGREDRTSRDGLFGDQRAPAASVTHLWLCFQASAQQGPWLSLSSHDCQPLLPPACPRPRPGTVPSRSR